MRIGLGVGSGFSKSRPFTMSNEEQLITLFSDSEGVMLDWTSSGRLYQTQTTDTPLTSLGQSIGYTKDVSGKNHPATQSVAGSRPVFSGVPKTLGTEKVVNGRLTTDTSWTKGAGWSIGSGVATKTAGVASSISQTISLSSGGTYQLHFSPAISAGSVTIQFTGGVAVTSASITASGSYVEVLVANTGNTTLEIIADAAFVGTVANISVKEVTDFSYPGALFFGAQNIKTGSVNLSTSDKATVVVSCRVLKNAGAVTSFDVGSYYANTAGSLTGLNNTKPNGRLRGSAASAIVATPSTEGPAAGLSSNLVMSFQVDLSKTTLEEELSVRTRGIKPLQTPTGSTVGTGNMVNGVITVGSSTLNGFYWKGLINRLLVINKTLTPTQLVTAEKWVRKGTAYCGVIGDSTIAVNNSTVGLPVNVSVSSLMGNAVCGAADVSIAGDKIADQKTKWLALPEKSALEAVFIQIGLNDINTYSGVSKTTSQIIADLQDLVNTVNTSKPIGCKTYISTLVPCRGWIGAASGKQSEAYQAWLDVNTSISGAGSTPITGVDARITSHTPLLSDGNGYLLPIYDSSNDHVHESGEARFIIAQSWMTQLEQDNLLS